MLPFPLSMIGQGAASSAAAFSNLAYRGLVLDNVGGGGSISGSVNLGGASGNKKTICGVLITSVGGTSLSCIVDGVSAAPLGTLIDNGNMLMRMFIADTPSSSGSVTVSASSVSENTGGFVYVYTVDMNSATPHYTGQNSGNAGSIAVTSVDLAANSFLIAVAGILANGASTSMDQGFTEDNQIADTFSGSANSLTPTGSSTVTVTATFNDSNRVGLIIAGFKGDGS